MKAFLLFCAFLFVYIVLFKLELWILKNFGGKNER